MINQRVENIKKKVPKYWKLLSQVKDGNKHRLYYINRPKSRIMILYLNENKKGYVGESFAFDEELKKAKVNWSGEIIYGYFTRSRGETGVPPFRQIFKNINGKEYYPNQIQIIKNEK